MRAIENELVYLRKKRKLLEKEYESLSSQERLVEENTKLKASLRKYRKLRSQIESNQKISKAEKFTRSLKTISDHLKLLSVQFYSNIESTAFTELERTFFLYNYHNLAKRKQNILKYYSIHLGKTLKEKVKSGFCNDISFASTNVCRENVKSYRFRHISLSRSILWKFYKYNFKSKAYHESIKHNFGNDVQVSSSEICPTVHRVKIVSSDFEEICYVINIFTTMDISIQGKIKKAFCYVQTFVPNIDYKLELHKDSRNIEVLFIVDEADNTTTAYCINRIINNSDQFSKSHVFSYLETTSERENTLYRLVSQFRIAAAVVE